MSKAAPTSRQKSSARLYAVQAVYQMLVANLTSRNIFENVELQPTDIEPEMDGVERPAPELFRDIVSGVERQKAELLPVIGNHLKGARTVDQMIDQEPLLVAILLASAYEMMAHADIDAPIIMSDYVEVTKSYYDGNESNFINGLMESFKIIYRV